MLDRIYEYIITQPQRLTELGKAVFGAASFALFAGAIEYVAHETNGQINRLSGIDGHFSLLNVLPAGFPTWWIPETPEGFVLSVVIALVGVATALEGRKFEKLLSRY